jgi:hypothetical protein
MERKSSISQVKNSVECHSSKLDHIKDRISWLENKVKYYNIQMKIKKK